MLFPITFGNCPVEFPDGTDKVVIGIHVVFLPFPLLFNNNKWAVIGLWSKGPVNSNLPFAATDFIVALIEMIKAKTQLGAYPFSIYQKGSARYICSALPVIKKICRLDDKIIAKNKMNSPDRIACSVKQGASANFVIIPEIIFRERR